MARQLLDEGASVIPNTYRFRNIQNVTLSATSQQLSFTAGTTLLVLSTGANGAIVLNGSNPTVTAGNGFAVPANTVMQYPITLGDKLAVLQSGTAGNLSVAECA